MLTSNLFRGKLYPSRKFSIGFCPKEKIKSEEKKYNKDYLSQEDTEHLGVIDWLTGSSSIEGEFCSTSEAPLFIKGSKSSREKRGSYGTYGITPFGRKVVENTSIILERRYGRKHLGFITCTLPNFPEELHRRLNGIWGEVVRRFYQKLKRQLEKISKPFIYVGVTEIQEKRYKRTGIPAPHLHFVYVCRSNRSSRYWLYVCQIHRAWNEAIREAIGSIGYPNTMSALPGWGSVHCKTVRKSAAGYLGKYISKGGKVLESMKENGWTEFPKQWWTASMQCKKMFKDSIIHLDSHMCNSFFYQLALYLHEGTITWASYVDVLIGDDYRTMGLVGVVSLEAYRLIQSSTSPPPVPPR